MSVIGSAFSEFKVGIRWTTSEVIDYVWLAYVVIGSAFSEFKVGILWTTSGLEGRETGGKETT